MSVAADRALATHLLEVATGAAADVGPYLRGSFAAGVASETKADRHDLVTECDRRSEEIIREHIFRLHPDSTFVGEEGGRRGNGTVVWYVDPVDGTNNFAHGIPFFCVSIAAVGDGEVLAAAVLDPIRDELFTATPEGAFLNGRPIRSSGHPNESAALLLTDFPRPRAQPAPGDYELFARLVTGFAVVRRLGCGALSLAYVASGRADACFLTHAGPWDVAAGLLLVERAGGRYHPLATPGASVDASPWAHERAIATCREFDLAASPLAALLG